MTLELPSNLLRDFAKIVNANKSTRKEVQNVYATVVAKENGVLCARLDGTDLLTPVIAAMEAQDGDRVIVSLSNHRATIVGNLTAPASARTAIGNMRVTEDGLIVGNLDADGNPVGVYLLLNSEKCQIIGEDGLPMATYTLDGQIFLGGNFQKIKMDLSENVWRLLDENGEVLATVSGDSIQFGKDSALHEFLSAYDGWQIQDKDGYAIALFSDDTIRLGWENAIRMTMADGKWKLLDENGEELVIFSGNDLRFGKDSAVNMSLDGTYWMLLGSDGASLLECSEKGFAVNAPVFTYNGHAVLDTGSLMACGTVTASGTVTAEATATVEKQVAVPESYILAGIREATATNGVLCGFAADSATNTVRAVVQNPSAEDAGVSVTLKWFALRSEAVDDISETATLT